MDSMKQTPVDQGRVPTREGGQEAVAQALVDRLRSPARVFALSNTSRHCIDIEGFARCAFLDLDPDGNRAVVIGLSSIPSPCGFDIDIGYLTVVISSLPDIEPEVLEAWDLNLGDDGYLSIRGLTDATESTA